LIEDKGTHPFGFLNVNRKFIQYLLIYRDYMP
jgi:hypothetical protein